MSEEKQPSVIRFEQAVKAKDYELACTELLSILSKIDSNFGGISDIELDMPSQLTNLEKDKTIYFCTRMAVAITLLFEDPDLIISENGAIRFLTYQRWVGIIFASSPYVNADHILRTYNKNKNSTEPNKVDIEASLSALIKFFILYLPESNILLNLDAVWERYPDLTASLCFALQSPRFLGTSSAFEKRSAILKWFPKKLAQIENLNKLPNAISHDVYMHCSYDTDANKHHVKRALNEVIRRHLLLLGWQDRAIKQINTKNGKPIMIVLLEHFNAAHSIYRTHSTSMKV